ncbi:MAG TPA: putative sugar nucleotidyl transferase [candidate division Zixibacteria bacterium]|nr:putative sugar nucleotidyl transferase [candidate division Zixibacteria bacterium]
MALTICFYEDSHFSQFFPLTYLRPVYLLRPGILPLFQQYEWNFKDAQICFSSRTQISSLVSQQGKDIPVNIIKKGSGDVLFLNGRIRSYGDLPKSADGCRLNTVFKNSGKIIGVLFKSDSLQGVSELTTPEIFKETLPKFKSVTAEYDTSATLYDYLWQIIDDIENSITKDFKQLESSLSSPHNPKVHEGSFFINENDVYLGNDVEIFPTAVIDASQGPVYIGAISKIMPQAIINGPCFIGANSIVLQGKISSSSIGPTSRVGGEVEASVFQSYVNKYHAGFIGHSYVGSWVNFGALTTNSDLKNNYSNVRVNVNGKTMDSGLMKVGSFIGDHCKFGIGTLLNTGISIGVSSNIFGGGFTEDKEVPPFSWGNSGKYEKYDIGKAVETAQSVFLRRGAQLSAQEEGALRAIHKNEISSEGCIDF